METLSKLTQKINEMHKIISDSTCRENAYVHRSPNKQFLIGRA